MLSLTIWQYCSFIDTAACYNVTLYSLQAYYKIYQAFKDPNFLFLAFDVLMVHSGSKDPKPEKISKTGSRPNCGHEKTQEAICVTCFNANRTKCTLKRYLPSYIDRHCEQVHQKTEIDVISYGDPRAVPILKALRSDPHVNGLESVQLKLPKYPRWCYCHPNALTLLPRQLHPPKLMSKTHRDAVQHHHLQKPLRKREALVVKNQLRAALTVIKTKSAALHYENNIS